MFMDIKSYIQKIEKNYFFNNEKKYFFSFIDYANDIVIFFIYLKK